MRQRAAIKQLAAAGGPLQPSLFDDRDMAEITSPDYPGERLVVCKNPLLAEQRARKRAELLAATENELATLNDNIRDRLRRQGCRGLGCRSARRPLVYQVSGLGVDCPLPRRGVHAQVVFLLYQKGR
jgi:hypothetical protein